MLRKWFILAFLLVFFGLLAACQSTQAPVVKVTEENSLDEPRLASETKVLSDEALVALENYNSETGLITFRHSEAPIWLDNLQQNDIVATGITNAAPYGFLRRVTHKEYVDDKVVLRTEQAALEDAVDNGSLSVTKFVDDNVQLQSAEGVTMNLVSSQATDWDEDLQPQWTLAKKCIEIIKSDTTSVKLSSNMKVCLAIEVDIKIGWGLKEVKAVASYTQKGYFDFEADYKSKFNRPVYLGTIPFDKFNEKLGFLPVVIEVDVDFYMGAKGVVEAHTRIRAEVDGSWDLGARYDRTNKWQWVNDRKLNFQVTQKEIKGSADLQIYLRANATVQFYHGAAEIKLKGKIYVGGKAEVNNCILKAEVHKGYKIRPRVRLIIWNWDKVWEKQKLLYQWQDNLCG